VTIEEILIPHGHPDHTGSAAALVALTGERVIASRRDAPIVRGEQPALLPQLLDWDKPLHAQTSPRVPHAPAVVPDRRVDDGDRLEWEHEAVVLAAPGHTPGSIAVWFECAQVLIAGDAIASSQGGPILGVFNADPAEAAASFRRLAHLKCEVACLWTW
jgi:glyoxylase-like metal-dependent hydrolase (beta-lactamase superfamily II)